MAFWSEFASAYAAQVHSACASVAAAYLPFFVFGRVLTRLNLPHLTSSTIMPIKRLRGHDGHVILFINGFLPIIADYNILNYKRTVQIITLQRTTELGVTWLYNSPALLY